MAKGLVHETGSELLAGVRTALATVRTAELGLASGLEQLALLREGLRLEGQLHTWLVQLAVQVDTAGVAWAEHGTSTATWLADAVNLTRREAAQLVGAGQGLARFGIVAAAAASGVVLPAQAEAMTGVLDVLPEDFPADVVVQGQELMVGFAATHNSTELRRLTGRLVEVLAPDTVEEREAARLEREHRLAIRHRYLKFTYDHRGSVQLSGSLPVGEAEPFIRILDSYGAARGSGAWTGSTRTRSTSPRR